MAAFLQGQIPHKVDPFFSLHRGPDEEEIIDGCRDWEALWDQQQPCTLAGRDKLREVSRHGLEIVGYKDTAFVSSAGSHFGITKAAQASRFCGVEVEDRLPAACRTQHELIQIHVGLKTERHGRVVWRPFRGP